MSKNILIKKFKEFNNGKNPFFTKYIEDLIQNTNEYIDFETIKEIYEKLIYNKAIIKTNKLNIFLYDSFDELNDELEKIINKSKNKTYTNSFLSKKYQLIANKKTYNLFGKLRESNIEKNIIKENFIKSIAALKTTRDLNFQLEKFVNSAINLDKENLIKKAKSLQAKVVYNENNNVIIAIDKMSQSLELGASRWCISRNESFFINYITQNNENKWDTVARELIKNGYQTNDLDVGYYLFHYNFNKSSTDKDFLNGYTINSYKQIINAFDNKNVLIPTRSYNEVIQKISNSYERDIDFDNLEKNILKDKNVKTACKFLFLMKNNKKKSMNFLEKNKDLTFKSIKSYGSSIFKMNKEIYNIINQREDIDLADLLSIEFESMKEFSDILRIGHYDEIDLSKLIPKLYIQKHRRNLIHYINESDIDVFKIKCFKMFEFLLQTDKTGLNVNKIEIDFYQNELIEIHEHNLIIKSMQNIMEDASRNKHNYKNYLVDIVNLNKLIKMTKNVPYLKNILEKFINLKRNIEKILTSSYENNECNEEFIKLMNKKVWIEKITDFYTKHHLSFNEKTNDFGNRFLPYNEKLLDFIIFYHYTY